MAFLPTLTSSIIQTVMMKKENVKDKEDFEAEICPKNFKRASIFLHIIPNQAEVKPKLLEFQMSINNKLVMMHSMFFLGMYRLFCNNFWDFSWTYLKKKQWKNKCESSIFILFLVQSSLSHFIWSDTNTQNNHHA